MPYLLYEEYINFGFTEIEEDEFDNLLKRASDVVDSITNLFYKFNNLEDDVTFRQEQFKKAVSCQVEYFHETGSITSYGMNEDATVTMGRTTLSKASRGRTAQQESSSTLVSDDVYLHLAPTGLLYRGTGVR